ncbi:hypothetical protein [Hymenobacter negativus]|uniref:hypothetical protein n=1 Tax=Hymenobacter negativus TaxID=2795026 RepID=UPI001AAF25A3|nr:hypothetical protein [Hymenobacter negativus]
MKARELNKAAQVYAKAQLGEAQFKRNKTAVRAISDDYKAGLNDGFQAGSAGATEQGAAAPKTVSQL